MENPLLAIEFVECGQADRERKVNKKR